MTLPLMWLPCRVCDRVAVPGENRVFSMTPRSQRQTPTKQDFFFLSIVLFYSRKTSPNGVFKCAQAYSQVETTWTNEFCGVANLYSAIMFGALSLKQHFSVIKKEKEKKQTTHQLHSINYTNMKQDLFWTECNCCLSNVKLLNIH